MLISGETALNELTDLYICIVCKNLNIAFGAERVKTNIKIHLLDKNTHICMTNSISESVCNGLISLIARLRGLRFEHGTGCICFSPFMYK